MSSNEIKSDASFNFEKPKWDQSSFLGRFKHFAVITDVRKAFATERQLNEAKELVTLQRNGQCPPNISQEKLWQAKHLYDSAFHPDSGEKMNLFGRMSFQVPGGMAVTGLLLQFFRTPAQVALSQWFNQSFNALVNYTNRNAAAETTTAQMAFAYLSASTTAVGVAVGLNFYSRKAKPVVARCMPFVAVASANAVNIPLSRQTELIDGVNIVDKDGNDLGRSKKCAKKGIEQVVFSRVVMAAPGMVFVPLIMEKMEKNPWFKSRTWLHLPFQTLGVGVFLMLMVPAACSLFPQTASMDFEKLEPDVQHDIKVKYGDTIKRVYFNKGL